MPPRTDPLPCLLPCTPTHLIPCLQDKPTGGHSSTPILPWASRGIISIFIHYPGGRHIILILQMSTGLHSLGKSNLSDPQSRA